MWLAVACRLDYIKLRNCCWFSCCLGGAAKPLWIKSKHVTMQSRWCLTLGSFGLKFWCAWLVQSWHTLLRALWLLTNCSHHELVHQWWKFYQYLISRNAVKIVQRLLRFTAWRKQNSLPILPRNSLSSLAAICYHAEMVFTQVAVICLVGTRFFFFSDFGCPSSRAATKDWYLVRGRFRAYKVAFRFIANEVPVLLPFPCMMKSKASECWELSEKRK